MRSKRTLTCKDITKEVAKLKKKLQVGKVVTKTFAFEEKKHNVTTALHTI